MMTSRPAASIALLAVFALTGATARVLTAPNQTVPPSTSERQRSVERGAYLVQIMSCHDCHTPWKVGPRGPEPDMSRALTGHPADLTLGPAPQLPEGWGMVGAETNTAYSGPWGVSFAANLTPDPDTGLGKWTVEMFIATMKTGRHQGRGRPLLPPMPFPSVGALTDSDIRDLFAYLQSLSPVRNRVPAPIEPPEVSSK